MDGVSEGGGGGGSGGVGVTGLFVLGCLQIHKMSSVC